MTLVENGFMAIAKEPTPGTFSEVGQVSLYVQTMTPKTDVGLAERNDISGGITKLSAVPTRQTRNLAFTAKVYPGDEIGLFINNLLGAPTTTGAGPYTHIWQMLEANLLQKFMSVELSEAGNTPDDYDYGCLGSLTISGSSEVGSYVTMEGNMVFQGRAAGVAPVSHSYTAVIPYTGCMASVSYAGAPISVDSWSIVIDMGYKLDNFKVDGTCEIQKPVINGKPNITATFEMDNADLALRAAYEAGTATSQLLVTLTHTTVAAATTVYSMTIEFPASQIMENGRSGDSGQMKESVTLMALPGTSVGSVVTPLEIKIVNNQTTYA